MYRLKINIAQRDWSNFTSNFNNNILLLNYEVVSYALELYTNQKTVEETINQINEYEKFNSFKKMLCTDLVIDKVKSTLKKPKPTALQKPSPRNFAITYDIDNSHNQYFKMTSDYKLLTIDIETKEVSHYLIMQMLDNLKKVQWPKQIGDKNLLRGYHYWNDETKESIEFGGTNPFIVVPKTTIFLNMAKETHTQSVVNTDDAHLF